MARAVGTRQRALADQTSMRLAEPVGALSNEARQRVRTGAEIVIVIGQIGRLADQRDRESRPFSQRLRMRALSTGASLRGLEPTISSASACVDAGDRRVEQIGGAAEARIELGPVLAAVEIDAPSALDEQLQREDFLDARRDRRRARRSSRLRRLRSWRRRRAKASCQEAGRSLPFSRI